METIAAFALSLIMSISSGYGDEQYSLSDSNNIELSTGLTSWAIKKVFKKKSSKVHDYSGGRKFSTYPKRKDPNSNRSNRFGPKKD